MSNEGRSELRLKGLAAAPGVVHGTAFTFLERELEIPSYQISEGDKKDEIKRFEQAVLETRQQIGAIRAEVEAKLGKDEARIFDAHLLVLDDKALLDETVFEVEETKHNVEYCFHEVVGRYIDAFLHIDDEYIKERVTDLRDVTRRVLNNLLGQSDHTLAKAEGEKIIVSEDLTPSDTAGLREEHVLAIATDLGSYTSHAAIIARSLEIPAVVGLHEATRIIQTGDPVLIDGYEGIVIVNPDKETLFRYGRIELEHKQLRQIYAVEAPLPAETLDGYKIELMANIEGTEDPSHVLEVGAEGVGLYRTEGLFLSKAEFPTEEEQCAEYSSFAQRFRPCPVVIRTMDLGGDKSPKNLFFPEAEENPFLGFRAIRFCLEHPDIFRVQLRAILRASAFGNVKLMYPMISGLRELVEANRILDAAKKELTARKIAFDEDMEVGAMIEVPSAVFIADQLSRHCQFFSIGTNDLIQFLLAVDRVNDRVAGLYEPNHPAVLRAIRQTIEAGHKANLRVAVCGEMAGDPLYAPLLIGMGADQLSVSPGYLSEIKFIIRKMKVSDTRDLAQEIQGLTAPSEILDRLQKFHAARLENSLPEH